MVFGQILEVDVANGTWTTDFMKQSSNPTGEDFFLQKWDKTLGTVTEQTPQVKSSMGQSALLFLIQK